MTTKSYRQFIYSNDTSNYNYPSGLTASDLVLGNIFLECSPIIQLGIQAPPGTKFYINGNNNFVIVGQTGLFDLNLIDNGSISSLRFDSGSIEQIQDNNSNILIVDILYLAQGDD